jgi:hypothetical protein
LGRMNAMVLFDLIDFFERFKKTPNVVC